MILINKKVNNLLKLNITIINIFNYINNIFIYTISNITKFSTFITKLISVTVKVFNLLNTLIIYFNNKITNNIMVFFKLIFAFYIKYNIFFISVYNNFTVF